ncbi:hypothetical protein JKF63_00908 [Porcisia hertigi]|uniref:Uncharacterized protein n=1 Tax=Porcisia hertigi TaxID=2761500 RepID=A0A836HCI3_9TRYP|nr:hypothetical protein JKF63_00908 [Porcisia hertigi]
MSFLGYIQSYLGPSHPSPKGTSRGGSDASAQRLGSGVWPLSPQVQEEMKKGTRYNMKVVLRGTRATGKSTLLARLSGHPLPTRYTPSTELIASTMRLQGEQCAPHEGTKVDIWEVIEEGRQRSASTFSANTGSKTALHIPTAQLHEALRVAADARSLNVYDGCHLVIFMIDPSQRSSWEYAKQETLQVPPTTCVLYALNFSDLAPLIGAGVAVTLDEVQSWCGRVRRATTTTMLRMLEGRQAPPEFSVRPMTAVLSAETGAGILGVVRALHVASTLVRIAAEEFRVQELLGLLARQQAVSIAGGDATPAPPPGIESVGGDLADQLRVHGGPLPHEVLASEPRTLTSSPPPLSNHSETPAFGTASQSSRRDAEPTLCGPAVTTRETKSQTMPTPQRGSGGLRMQHHSSAPACTVGNWASSTNGDGKSTQLSQASLNRSTKDAEAMRLFLGNSDTGESRESSLCSSKSSSASGAASDGCRAPAKCRTGAHLSNVSNALPRAVSLTRESQTANCSGAPRASTNGSGFALPPLSEEVPSRLLATPQVMGPPAEECVNTWVSDMVQDMSGPLDSFFGEEEEEEDEPRSTASECSPATPSSSSQKLGPPGLRTAPLLGTRRVVRRAGMHSSFPTTAPTPEFDADVATILAQMTAALTADVPALTADAGSDDAVVQRAGELGSAKNEASPRKGKAKCRHTALDSRDSRGYHRHRKRHLDAAKGNTMPPAAEVSDEVVSGSFDLNVV